MSKTYLRDWPDGVPPLASWQVHRGYWREGCAQNSIAAFQSAKAGGARMVECDVRITRDGVVVLFHDSTLNTSHGRKRVRMMSYSDLQSYGVETLESALQALPDLYFNIEIKGDTPGFRLLVAETLGVIRACGAESRVLISSFNPLCIRWTLDLAPDIPSALLVRSSPWANQLLVASMLKPHLLHLPEALATASRLRRLKKQGYRVAVWTVNDRDRAEIFMRRGAVSIISDLLPPPA